MPDIRRRNPTLAEMFVFYKRLNTDPDPTGLHAKLYNAAKSSFEVITGELSEVIQSAAIIRSVGMNEARKEQSLLYTIFGKDLNIDFSNEGSVKNFIDTLNACLNLKQVYERNVILIKETRGSKPVFSFFPGYFLDIWNPKWPKISEEIDEKIHENPSQDILSIVREIVYPEIKEIIPQAVKNMLTAEPELEGKMPKELKDAYFELLSAIGEVEQQGSIAARIASIYQLDKIADSITESIIEGEDSTKKIERIKKTANVQYHQRGGSTLEAIENSIFNLVADSFVGKVHGGHVYESGKKETGFKPDNIISFNIDPQIIQESLETAEATSRERNKKLFEELGKKLKNIQDGYIVYSSDKNYSFNKGFKERGGFQADSISLETYQKIMKYTTRNARTFVGTILQTAKEAIGDPALLDTLQQAMAQDIAYFLFDDFKTIGEEVKAGDTHAIHIMNLNGVLIPLSFFLIKFAEAIESEAGNPDDFVRVDIKVPKIEFSTQEEQNAWQERNGASPFDAWVYQRQVALTKSKIEVHFLRSFKELLSKYL